VAVIDKKKLPEKVIDEIRNRLERGQLKVGDKLPNQNDLSSELGVSRTSLREAMKILDLLGVIEQRPGYGTVIRKEIPELNAKSAHLPLMSDVAATYELLEAREILECGAVRLAAQKASDAQIGALYDLVEKMEDCLKNDDRDAYKKNDQAFHGLISLASGNRFLNDPSIVLNQYMAQFIDENIELLPGLVKESQKYHRAVWESIARHDPDGAENEMRRHIRAIAKSYKRWQATAATGKKADPYEIE
jgi:GntR family transcriptional repressor for pyruvate dehydrogenase complex